MKKSFKRFLSSVLATVVAVASMSIGMTVTASAATNTYELIPSATEVNTDDYFGGSHSFQTNSGALAATSVVNAAGETVTISRGYKLNGSSTYTFTTTSDSSTVTMIWSARQDKTSTCTAGLDGVLDTATPADGLKTKTYTNVAAGTHTIARGASEGVLYYIRVDETFSDNAKTYTINGTCNLANTSFTIGDMDATVDASGNWTASKVTESAPFAVGDSLAVSLTEYAASPESVTLAAGTDEFTFDGGNITFTKYELQAIAEGTYSASNIEAGLPNFDKSSLVIDGTGKYKTSSLKIMLSDVATITVNGKCGSTTSGRSASVTVNGETYTSNAGDEFTDYTFVNVPAGEQTIAFESSNTTFQVASITVTYGSTVVTTYTWVLDTNALTIGIDTSKLSLANSTTTSTTNTLQYTGTGYTLNADNVTVTGTPDAENKITVTPQDSWFTEVAPPAGAITDKATLTFDTTVSQLAAATDYGYFTLLEDVSVDKNGKAVDGLGSYTHRIKTSGKTTLVNNVPSNRAIKFSTADAATLQFVAMSSSSSKVAKVNVYASDGTIVDSVEVDGASAHLVTMKLPKADTYYMATDTQAFNVYSVNVVVGETITSVDTTKSVFTDTTDAYVIAKVSSADVVAGNTLVMQSDGQAAVESDVVYKGAIIDGQYVTAEEIGADFIYVVKAVGAKLENVANVLVSIVTAQ